MGIRSRSRRTLVLSITAFCVTSFFSVALALLPPTSSHFTDVDATNTTSSGTSAANKFGIGLVAEGSSDQLDLAHDLSGDGGWVLLIFAGLDETRTQPDQSWVDGVAGAYDRNLHPVVRMSPGWGSAHFRDLSDDADHMDYTTLATAYAATVKGLPLKDGQNLYIQLHNEPDLCYEWYCSVAESDPLPYTTVAAEYAAFANQSAAAIRALGDVRIRVGAAGLAPGGCSQCGCCGQENCPGDNPGITGLQFMTAMEAAVPGVYSRMDFLATHSYPASGVGYGFNVAYNNSLPGLDYYIQELNTIAGFTLGGEPVSQTSAVLRGRNHGDDGDAGEEASTAAVINAMPVLVTETGWASHRDGLPSCSEADKAQWYVDAYTDVWIKDDRVIGVMPFMLQDATWGDNDGYAFVLTNGNKQPAFTSVKNLRCSIGIGGGCAL